MLRWQWTHLLERSLPLNREERTNDLEIAVAAALQGWQSGLWTALPAIVKSFDPEVMTITAQPAIKARVRSADENPPLPGAVLDVLPFWWVELPLLVDVPVIFQGGGIFTMTLPIQAGDECLVIFSSRCIDNFWYLGEVQTQAELRMHDLSDGFALVGLRSKPRALENINTENAELRSDDGTVKIELTSDSINITASTAVNVSAPAVKLSNGGAVNKLVNELFKTSFDGHIHPAGAGFTGAPTVAMPASNLTSVAKAE